MQEVTNTSSAMTQSKADQIAETQAKLPLPEQPPVASDWQSADARNVNVGSGGVESHAGTDSGASAGLGAGAATKDSGMDMSKIGREGKDGLDGPPKDAVAK